MRETKVKLPSWSTWKNGQAIVNVDDVYPRYLTELGLEPSQFSAAVAKFCITRDLVGLTQQDGLTVRFQGSEKWADKNLSPEQGSHDDGMQAAGRFRERMLQSRAAKALASE